MKYFWRTLCPSLLLIINLGGVILYSSFSPSILFFILVNVVIFYFVGLIIDKFILSYKELRISKKQSEQYKQAIQSARDGIAIVDINGEIQCMNDALLDIYGFERDDLKSGKQLASQDVIGKMKEEVLPELKRTGYWRGELEGRRHDGTPFPHELSFSQIAGTDKFINVVRDLTEEKENEKLINQLVWHNDLSELPNRRAMLKMMNSQIEIGEPFSFFFIDLDEFKNINDVFGHFIGDHLLQYVGSKFKELQSDELFVYHLGGDEFTVLSLGNRQDDRQVADSIVQKLADPVELNGNTISVTPSIGISRYLDDSSTMEQVMKNADLAMYYAKQQGKGKSQLFCEEFSDQYERKIMLENELKHSMANNELYVVFQTKHDLLSGELVGMESLLRWSHPQLGNISPIEFIPIAEQSHQIIAIGEWVLNESLAYLTDWIKAGHEDLKVSVNISKKQLVDRAFIPTLKILLDRYQVDPGQLELEITESITSEVDDIIPSLVILKELGVGLSIDDFGKGYSSLSVLNTLPIDTLKIDRSFVQSISSTKYGLDIIKSIIDIGKNMDLCVVAEGVETEAHLEELKKLNCPVGQGYYFSKPLTPERIKSEFLEREGAAAIE
ncbi:EAL domain-containing protein [Virgibacillus xinjiangensis]|uniref:EAL domain-containing protein n=1 Tax=Virgibacillus xinjiangensis TaxID=393090 RepID=A0ABV7CVQ8_9BACI